MIYDLRVAARCGGAVEIREERAYAGAEAEADVSEEDVAARDTTWSGGGANFQVRGDATMARLCRLRRACRPSECARPSQGSVRLLLGERLVAHKTFHESRPGARRVGGE